MLKAACANGWLEEKRVVLETLMSIRRAGAVRGHFVHRATARLRDCVTA